MRKNDRHRSRTSIARGTILSLLVLLSACSAALAQNVQRAQASTGFSLTRRVTEYDEKGNTFPSLTETLYVSSKGNWRYVGTYPNGQVVETMLLCGKGVFFHDHRNERLQKFGSIGPGCPSPGHTTAESLQANPEFVSTEYVFGHLAYLHRRKMEGVVEETYYTPETGPFPFKRVSYYDGYKRVEEPVSLVFGEPDVAQLRGEDYRVVEQKPVQVGDLAAQVQEQPAPQYPALARQAGLHGKVELQVIVDETGQVISAVILRGPPLLGEAAMEAAYSARLTPIEKDGKPIKVKGYLNYQFKPEPAVAAKPD